MRSFTIIERAFDYCIINGTPEREKDCLAFKDLKYSRQMQGISRPVLLNNGCVRLLLPNWRLFKAFLPWVLLLSGLKSVNAKSGKRRSEAGRQIGGSLHRLDIGYIRHIRSDHRSHPTAQNIEKS